MTRARRTTTTALLLLAFGSGFAGNCFTDLEDRDPTVWYDCRDANAVPAKTCAEVCERSDRGPCTNADVCEHGPRAFTFKADCGPTSVGPDDVESESMPVDVDCDDPLVYTPDIAFYGCCCS